MTATFTLAPRAAAPLRSRLLVREATPLAPACRLVCFPYAGGNATIYRGWQAALGSRIDVIAIEPPGRGGRFCEDPIGDLNTLVEQFVPEIVPLLDVPTVFFGHSNGALMAYVLARRLQRERLSLPRHLILSAKRPPHLERQQHLHSMPTTALIERLKVLNGTPPEILNNPEMMELVLPLLRADFSLSETYMHEDGVPLACPATLLGATRDPEVDLAEVAQWARYVEEIRDLVVIDGGHFFVHEQRERVLGEVRGVIQEISNG